MTLDQFLDRLREEAPKHRWMFIGDGMVRNENCLCPIEVLAGWDGDPLDAERIDSPWPAAKQLGLDPDTTEWIIEIADSMRPYTASPFPRDLIRWRNRLLEYCGLA